MLPDGSDHAKEGGELTALVRIADRLGPARIGEVGVGDDTAVLVGAPRLLFATDVLVEGVHFRRDLGTLADAGWKALASNLSDVAAMGGSPMASVVGISGADAATLEELYDGLELAAATYDCPIVGGDLTGGDRLVVSVAILGRAGDHEVLRSNGRPGDVLFVTGPLGAAAAGLRMLEVDRRSTGPCVEAFRRPVPRLAEGAAAGGAGATAMIDISDGFGLDLERLAVASGVGVEVDLLPVATGASHADALGGGEDYELVFAAPSREAVAARFAAAGIRAPIEIGRLVEDRSTRVLEGGALVPVGYTHTI